MNNERFAEIFRDSPELTVPAVTDGLYTEWAMAQEMSHGRHIDDPEFAPQGPRLARVLVETCLRQFFREGVGASACPGQPDEGGRHRHRQIA